MSLWQLFKAIPRSLAALIVGVGTFLHKQWHQYTEFGQFLWLLALFAMAVDAGIAYEFGSTLSYLHAAGFALVALAFCIFPDVAALEWRKGRTAVAGWMGVACVPLGFVALLTHIGYGASIRVGDMQQASVHNAKFEDARSALESDRANLKMWRDQLAKLTADNAWAATVKAEALRDQLANAEEYIKKEAARGGCKSKCEARMRERDALVNRIGIAEKATDLTSRIEATQRIIDKKTAEVDGRNFVSSAATNHNDTLFKAISLVTGTWVSDVTMSEREATNTGIMSISSIAFLLLAPMFYFAAGLNRRPGVIDAWLHPEKFESRKIELKSAKVAPEPEDAPRGKTTVMTIEDSKAIQMIREAIAAGKASVPQGAAA